MIHSLRIALLTIRLVMRTKTALFFTFLFPVIFLFIYAGLFAHGNPEAVVFMFGPVVTLNIMGSGFWGLGMQSVMQRERGSLRRYRLAPIGPGTIVMSNLLANYLLGIPTVGLLVFCAMAFFHMPLKVSLLTLLVLVTAGTFAFAGFGLTIASVANTMQEAQIYNNVAWLTLLFLSGVTIPLPLLPHWIQRVAAFLPATYLVVSFQGAMLQGDPLTRHAPELVVLLVCGTFGLLFAWKLFRWEKDEPIPRRAKWLALAFTIPFLVTGAWMNRGGRFTASAAKSYSLLDRRATDESKDPAIDHKSIIEDFENPGGAEEILKRWQVSTDSNHLGQSIADIALISPGANATPHALRIRGHLSSGPGAAQSFVSARHELVIPQYNQNLHGIQFEVRGDARVYQVQLHPTSKAASLEPTVSFVPLPDWQPVRLPVGWLAAPPAVIARPLQWSLEILVAGQPGEFCLDIDEIRFY